MWDDDKILKGCRQGRRKAQAALYEKYASSMRAVCRRYLGMRPESEDVLHDAMIKALGRMSQFKQKGSLEGWLKRIAMTTSLDYLNKHKKVVSNSQTMSLEIEETKAEEEEEDVGFMADLKKHNIGSKEIFSAMDNLPDGYRAILNMYVVDNIRHKEIAKRMGISANTSKSQLSRARKLLKKNISDMMKGEKHVR